MQHNGSDFLFAILPLPRDVILHICKILHRQITREVISEFETIARHISGVDYMRVCNDHGWRWRIDGDGCFAFINLKCRGCSGLIRNELKSSSYRISSDCTGILYLTSEWCSIINGECYMEDHDVEEENRFVLKRIGADGNFASLCKWLRKTYRF